MPSKIFGPHAGCLRQWPPRDHGIMMKKSIAALAFAVLSAAASALPTTQQVEAAVQQAHYAQAKSMMSEVVAAKPDSAKAHYVYAEMLAHNRNFAKATQEVARARQLDPAIKFTTPDKFSAFEQLLQREQTTSQTRSPAAPYALAPRPVQASPSFPAVPGWVWATGLAAIAFLLWRGFNRSRAGAPVAGSAALAGTAAPVAGSPLNPSAPPGIAPYGTGMPSAAPGGGMLGTGMAVAGGVAGGMLLGEMLNNRGGAGTTPPDRLMPDANPLAPNDAATELENRPVDLGNGGDWDAGGSADLGGGSDGGGGWD